MACPLLPGSAFAMIRTTQRGTVSALVACALIALAPQATRSQDLTADLAIFDRYVEALRRQVHIPGLSAAIVHGGQVVWSRGYGFQDVEARVAATPDTIYDIASLTKTFASTLIMQCVERGSLDL